MDILGEPLVFVDIETNGLNHVRGRVIEVAAIRVEQGEITKTFNKIIDPGIELPRFITQLTGITSDDLRGAPVFLQIAEELHDVLDGAVFVAHNVRFDYSFLKQEFSRVGKDFQPRQLCTVKLSRALYPEHKSHKLESLIARHNLQFEHRHRAYDDAHALWQFLQIVADAFTPETLQAAIAKQLRQPALPRAIDPQLVKELPQTPGVYIFEDEQGRALYVGKSVNIKKRVLSHFVRDHENVQEFKIAQTTHAITARQTVTELEALLLESQLVKELQPLHNRMLRKTDKLLLARQYPIETGHMAVVLEEANQISPDDLSSIIAVYPTRGKARSSFTDAQKTFELCPKLLGLEKGKGACFQYQLHKCQGACVNTEDPTSYNQRLLTAFEHQRIETWPYSGPIMLGESGGEIESGIIVDQWCVLGSVKQEPYCEPVVTSYTKAFDMDTYKIVRSYLTQKTSRLRITPLSADQLHELLT